MSSSKLSVARLVVLVGLAAMCGVMIAMGEVQAMYVSLALIASLTVLYDFRVGAVLLMLAGAALVRLSNR